MRQVLFHIPIVGIPLYGFGAMLCLAFILCTWLASRRAEKEGIRPQIIQDLGFWLLIGGIIGARLTYLLTESRGKLLSWTERLQSALRDFYKIWDGGLVLYGSVIGGVVAYLLAYYFLIRKNGVSSWKVADVIAPTLALGVGLGRIGCLLNGCCYGAVACPDCIQVPYPLSGMPRFDLVQKGYQTPAGFTMSDRAADDRTVGAVAAGSKAAASGLRAGDVIVKLRDFPYAGQERAIKKYWDLENDLTHEWPRGKNDLALTVKRGEQEFDLPPFEPWTLGLYPTQVYESISMFLAFFLLLAYWPVRRQPGELMALFMFCYGLQRFLVEMLRADPRPGSFERYGSIILMVAGPLLFVWLRWLSGGTKGLAKGTS